MPNQIEYLIGCEENNGLILPLDRWISKGDHKPVRYYCITGVCIPSLPIAKQTEDTGYVQQVIKRFTGVLRNLHYPEQGVAFGLYVLASPEEFSLGAKINFYILCRAVSADETTAIQKAFEFVQRVQLNIPKDGLLSYVAPRPAKQSELQELLFHQTPDSSIQVVEVVKFKELGQDANLPENVPGNPIFHPFLMDPSFDPWITLVDVLSDVQSPTVVAINLEPINLTESREVAELSQRYRKIKDLNEKRFEISQTVISLPGNFPGQVDNDINKYVAESEYYQLLRIPDHVFSRVRRGFYCYNNLLAWQDQLFLYSIIVASEGALSSAVTDAIRGGVTSLNVQQANSDLGWMRPDIDKSNPKPLLQNLRWIGSPTISEIKGQSLWRIRHLLTSEEASILFHIPVFPANYQSSSITLVDSPFSIPPEVLSTSRFEKNERLVNVGWLYQRDQRTTLDFKFALMDLRRPSLLVGAPGSGKSNLALHILIQLWEHNTPFLVLDPSTGHEYRYLLAKAKPTNKLRDSLVLFTCGDQAGLPFRFNPFEVPRNTTVRAHITRLLSCFKAAYEMWDPLPAIYEGALIRLYTDRRFGWDIDEKGSTGKPFPCMSDFADAIIQELDANVLPDYGKGTEASGILTGASKIRINGILNSLGHVINVRESDPTYFRRLLQNPVVIEFGSIGDPSSIALVMAFLVIQLVGNIEAIGREREQENAMHLILIEEAHRLLSAEGSSTGSQNQGNTRGKSAEELNTLLAEVRKFQQGIMVLDQRPSSLVGGVLDNADINILCRLNDRVGFEHLSNMVNLNADQQRYAKTRLKAGEAILLDKKSGLPVLVRPDNIIDLLKNAALSPDEELSQLLENTKKQDLLPPKAETVSNKPFSTTDSNRDTLLNEKAKNEILEAATDSNWSKVERLLTSWVMDQQNKKAVKRHIFAEALKNASLEPQDIESLFREFDQLNTQ